MYYREVISEIVFYDTLKIIPKLKIAIFEVIINQSSTVSHNFRGLIHQFYEWVGMQKVHKLINSFMPVMTLKIYIEVSH